MILRREFSEWLEWSFESDLGMRFAKWCLDLAIRDFASFKFKNRSLKSVSYFLIFVIRENEILIFVNRDPLFFRFVNRARDPPCRTLMYGISINTYILPNAKVKLNVDADEDANANACFQC